MDVGSDPYNSFHDGYRTLEGVTSEATKITVQENQVHTEIRTLESLS